MSIQDMQIHIFIYTPLLGKYPISLTVDTYLFIWVLSLQGAWKKSSIFTFKSIFFILKFGEKNIFLSFHTFLD